MDRGPRTVDGPAFGCEWFDRHQRELVQLANQWWVREYLGLTGDRGPGTVVGLWPNAVHLALPDGRYRAVFYGGKPWYACRLRDLARWERSPALGRLGARLIASDPRLAMVELAVALQSTFNPDANPETTSVDGLVFRNATGSTWAGIRDGAGTGFDDSQTNSNFVMLDVDVGATTWLEMRRGIFLFDTSSLPDGATIDAAVLSFYVTAKTETLASQSLGIVTSTPASNTALAAADYAQLGTTRQASDIALSSLTLSAYNDFTFNATGRGNVSKTGVSKFGARFASDIDNAEPTRSAGQRATVAANMGDNASNKPKLVVDYSLPGSRTLTLLQAG